MTLAEQVQAELIRSTQVAVDTSRVMEVRSIARNAASEWAMILVAMRGVEE